MRKIRLLTPADYAALAILTASQPTAPHLPGVESLFAPASLQRILLGAEACGTLVAFAVARPVADEAELESIVVAGTHQRQGIASQLLSALVEELRRRGILSLHLEVRPSNLAALALYRAAGFCPTGRRPGYYSNPAEDALLMTLSPLNFPLK